MSIQKSNVQPGLSVFCAIQTCSQLWMRGPEGKDEMHHNLVMYDASILSRILESYADALRSTSLRSGLGGAS